MFRKRKRPDVIVFVNGAKKPEDLELQAARIAEQLDKFGVAAVDSRVAGIAQISANSGLKGKDAPQ